MRLSGHEQEVDQSSGCIANPDNLGAEAATRTAQRLAAANAAT